MSGDFTMWKIFQKDSDQRFSVEADLINYYQMVGQNNLKINGGTSSDAESSTNLMRVPLHDGKLWDGQKIDDYFKANPRLVTVDATESFVDNNPATYTVNVDQVKALQVRPHGQDAAHSLIKVYFFDGDGCDLVVGKAKAQQFADDVDKLKNEKGPPDKWAGRTGK